MSKIRISESELRQIIKESVEETLNELSDKKIGKTIAKGINAANNQNIMSFGSQKLQKKFGAKKSSDEINKQVGRIADLSAKTGHNNQKNIIKHIKDNVE